MSERNKRPGLSSRPPGPRELDAFLEGADKPRTTEAPAPSPAAPVQPGGRDARSTAKGTALPWEAPGFAGRGWVAFKVRMSSRHHAMLQWLKAETPRKSMNDWALDLLEPAIEEAVRRKREELGE